MTTVCIYAICKNEEQFVDRFMDSVQQADKVCVLDTGSTDNTVEKLKNRGAIVEQQIIKPWRFDVARNIAIERSPDCDILFSIDLDEIIKESDWKDRLLKAWKTDSNRGRYKYVWDHLPNGGDGRNFNYEKIHTKDYEWYLPCHEILRRKEGRWGNDHWAEIDISVHHYPDGTKSRGNYLGLLEIATKEAPDNDRMAHYYGRELFYQSQWEKAIEELTRHTKLSTATWADERAASMTFIATCYDVLRNDLEAERWHLRACAEAIHVREPLVMAAKFYNSRNRFPMGYALAKRAMQIENGPISYISTSYAQNEGPHDLTSTAAYYIGLKAESLSCAYKAHELAPWDGRLKENADIIERMHPGLTEKTPMPKIVKYESWTDDPKFGLVIATYASTPYVHLALAIREKLYKDIPTLVIDDCSDESLKLETIANDYGCDFISNNINMNHTRGDLLAIANGLRWANYNKLDVMVKMSRRFIPKIDWRPSLRDVISKTTHATYSGIPDLTWEGLRTECIGLHVSRWIPYVEEVEKKALDASWLWVERDIRDFAVRILPWGIGEQEGAAIWNFLGLGKFIKTETHLWHDTALPTEYVSLARSFGLNYTTKDFEKL